MRIIILPVPNNIETDDLQKLILRAKVVVPNLPNLSMAEPMNLGTINKYRAVSFGVPDKFEEMVTSLNRIDNTTPRIIIASVGSILMNTVMNTLTSSDSGVSGSNIEQLNAVVIVKMSELAYSQYNAVFDEYDYIPDPIERVVMVNAIIRHSRDMLLSFKPMAEDSWGDIQMLFNIVTPDMLDEVINKYCHEELDKILNEGIKVVSVGVKSNIDNEEIKYMN